MNTIQEGSFLTLHYRLAGPDGADVINTFADKPATLSLGNGELAPAMERRLVGLPEGTRQTFELAAGEAFGEMSYLGTKDFQRTATVAALVDITMIEIADEALSQSTESCRNRFNAAFLDLLVSRLESANIRVSQLLLDRNIGVR